MIKLLFDQHKRHNLHKEHQWMPYSDERKIAPTKQRVSKINIF